MQSEFIYKKIKKLKVDALIDRSTPARDMEVESFFLSLSLIYNDIKGICVLERDFVDKYRRPIDGEISGHAGEWCGIKNQLFKILASTLYEALNLIQSRKSLIEGSMFQRYYQKLNRRDKNIWFLLLNVSGVNKEIDYNQDDIKSFEKLLIMIRNKISYHYDNGGIDLLNGYRKYFYNDLEKPGKDAAMYSTLRSDFWQNRYYYADAALVGFLHNEYAKLGHPEQNITDTIYEMAIRVAVVIMGLLDAYHEDIRKV